MMKLGTIRNLEAACPVCGMENLPYEVNVVGWDDVFCRYECEGSAPCEVCHGDAFIPDTDGTSPPVRCEECEGTGRRPCRTHYAADSAKSSWEE